MSSVVMGAEITILADLGNVPFVLDLHSMDYPDALLNPIDVVMRDVTCDVLHAEWSWGASRWQGPITTVEAGMCTLVLHDPDRLLDPVSTATHVVPGASVQVLVDDVPAWTGYVAEVTHSLYTHESILRAHDAIAQLALMTYHGNVPAGSTRDQFSGILTWSGWVGGSITYGYPAGMRAVGKEPTQAWEGLLRVQRAELGSIWADRTGRVAYRARGMVDEPGPAILPVIGCEGADLDDATTMVQRPAIVNHVLVEADDTLPLDEWEDPVAVQAYGRRTLRGKRDELRLTI